jgi:hypothetical protein
MVWTTAGHSCEGFLSHSGSPSFAYVRCDETAMLELGRVVETFFRRRGAEGTEVAQRFSTLLRLCGKYVSSSRALLFHHHETSDERSPVSSSLVTHQLRDD